MTTLPAQEYTASSSTFSVPTCRKTVTPQGTFRPDDSDVADGPLATGVAFWRGHLAGLDLAVFDVAKQLAVCAAARRVYRRRWIRGDVVHALAFLVRLNSTVGALELVRFRLHEQRRDVQRQLARYRREASPLSRAS
jgi:hypothetical protein